VASDPVQMLRLPLSGLIYQLRSDGWWRCLHQAQYDAEMEGRLRASPDEWTSPDLPVDAGGHAQWPPGAHEGESWWVLYGDNRHGSVMVTLADGQTPTVDLFGPLWLCEWISAWQAADVQVGGEGYEMFRRASGFVLGGGEGDD
jgi:hypothetical protein